MRKTGSFSPPSEFEDSLYVMADLYGQTPPRTRLIRRQRQRKQRVSAGEEKFLTHESRPRTNPCRRSNLDTMLVKPTCDKTVKICEEGKEEAAKDGSRKCKRSLKLLRGNERDLKLDVGAALSYVDKDDHLQVSTPNNMKVETRNRFRCLLSKPVGVEEKKAEKVKTPLVNSTKEETAAQSPRSQSIKEREIFHDTFSFLIKLGSSDKERNCHRQMSREETRWQNELKDLIWLELQAHHAERTPMAQDEYLCKQREAVGTLLAEIIKYRFDSTARISETGSASMTCNDDPESNASSLPSPNVDSNVCPGCLSMFCRACSRAQSEALKQVEGLLARLEAAEVLYPSSHAFATHYPLYKSPEFTDRVKAMCLWYNMTKHHRLKLLILGKLLMLLHTKKRHEDSSDSGISSRSSDTVDSMESRQVLVRFELSQNEDSISPSDSSNSNSSSVGGFSFGPTWPSRPELSYSCLDDDRLNRLDFYLLEFDRIAYRKYIEDVLKTRGLRKSLNFLERLHTSILRKARLTLQKPDSSDSEGSATEEYEGDRELKRYGVWSPEAQALHLPSYRAAFVFLSRVPLDVVHEFLRIRLEQKPDQPSTLSVGQLMRELREGIRIACIHRDRFAAHSKAAIASDESIREILFQEDVKEFDESLQAVFEVYLDYLQQWVDMVQRQSFNKNFIENEWLFVESISGKIKNGHVIAASKFCGIACTLIQQVKNFLTDRPRRLRECVEVKEDDEWLTKFHMMSIGREWQCMFVEAREELVKSVAFARALRRDIEKWSDGKEEISESVSKLKNAVVDLRHMITVVIENFQNDINQADEPKVESDRAAMRTRIREILHQAYRMGFEYYKELCKLFLPEERTVLARSLVSFARLWMDFVRTRCERGRGLRPRWANQGLDFLMTVCEPLNTKHLTDQEFEELKTCMDRCISHVVGTATPVGNSDVENLKKIPRSRATSPSQPRPRTSSFSLSQRSRENLDSPDSSMNVKKYSGSPVITDGQIVATLTVPDRALARQQRIAFAINNVERELDERLRSRELIGQVTDRKKDVDRVYIKAKRVTFTWQRGIKIGQGRFGKVYTVVNNRTGELLAMKEVQLQPGDHRAIRRVAEELQIFEGIQHKHLVRYYGVEIHREEMLIFMEFCAEGTLQSLVACSGNGLPESLVRKYTHQLLLAVAELHTHGIVHRDIKIANIFLTDEGNCLKLGDFGSAVQIKAHTTMPGELQGFVGTQAYMAPEVFMKTESEGHGRAADIWSVGCCVIEMASGRRPWAEYDSNYQIMFKVGMGETPPPPKTLSQEGIIFIQKCLQHDSKKRATASALLLHTFARSYEDVNVDLVKSSS
ncbi:mitogen-activated protein kinase kinase kinase 4 isoform X2 [Orussus abietinus]|uniref:mitogen-activated protein kinase kinase kinase 4 isoform X2 n=1 Tax=Orussus abietinus TaxID=222816 RepID=UPI000626C5F1|nr:mitogen-activated protein kinase kinase kinase 4 isoform X2 [Orussus abietinus]